MAEPTERDREMGSAPQARAEGAAAAATEQHRALQEAARQLAAAAEQLARKDQLISDTRERWVDCQSRLAAFEQCAQQASGVFDAGAEDCIAIMKTRAAAATHTHAELATAYPLLAERISAVDWERKSLSEQCDWALHQAGHAWSMLTAQAGNDAANAATIEAQRGRITELEAALRQIAGPGKCAGLGPEHDIDGSPLNALGIAQSNRLHKQHCKRCIAQAALAQKGGQ